MSVFTQTGRLAVPKSTKVNYGLPYMGSKSKIIAQFAYLFPKADNFYDLFGGGFSVTHFMCQRHSRDYKTFHFNEIRPGVCDLIRRAMRGEYSQDRYKMPWVSREEFHAKKDTDAFIKLAWSFGNDGQSYIFGEHIEDQKRSLHQCVVFDEFDDCTRKITGLKIWPAGVSLTNRRLFIRARSRAIQRRNVLQQQQLERLERLERLQQIESLERRERLVFYSLDYRSVPILPGSVIYCDIPYLATKAYDHPFSHAEFFNWADAQANPVFISEYEIKDKRFTLVKEFKHISTMGLNGVGDVFYERVYANRAAGRA